LALAVDMRDKHTIPDSFPYSISDKELEESIKGYMNVIIKERAQENVVIQTYPLVALGQYELQKRQNSKIIKFTTGISVVSLIVAASALYITYTNTRSSERWENSQISALHTLINTSESQKARLIEIESQLKSLENIQNKQSGILKERLMAIETNTANKALNSDAQKARVR